METSEILDTSVAIERREGTITVLTLFEHPPCNKKSFDIIFPEIQDYAKALDIATLLREKGTPLGAIDIILAAMCLNRTMKLITKDKDFKVIQSRVPEFQCKFV